MKSISSLSSTASDDTSDKKSTPEKPSQNPSDLLPVSPQAPLFNGINPFVYVANQLLAVTIISVTIYWLTKYFDRSNKYWTDRIIYLHPILMTVAFIFLFGNSLLLLNNSARLQGARTKMPMISGLVAIIGMIVAILWHSQQALPHFDSLHSWLAMITIMFSAIFYAYGHIVYFRTGYSVHQRTRMLGQVRMLAAVVLVSAGITCLMGISQAMLLLVVVESQAGRMDQSNNNNGNDIKIVAGRLWWPNMMANLIGTLLVAYIGVTIWMMAQARYIHPNRKNAEIEQQMRRMAEYLLRQTSPTTT